MGMIGRVLVIAAVAGAAVGVGAAPASASCYPQKPQTCHTCHVTGVHVGDDGIWLIYECP